MPISADEASGPLAGLQRARPASNLYFSAVPPRFHEFDDDVRPIIFYRRGGTCERSYVIAGDDPLEAVRAAYVAAVKALTAVESAVTREAATPKRRV